MDEYFSFEELVKNAALPSCASDLAIKHFGKLANRVIVPILDAEANVSYYCMCLSNNKNTTGLVFQAIERNML